MSCYLIGGSESVREGTSPQVPFPPLPFRCLSVLPLPLPTHTFRSRITKEKMSSKTRQIIVVLDLGSSGFKLKIGSLYEARHVKVPLESRLKVMGAGGGGKLVRSSIPPSGEVATLIASCYWNRRYGPFRPECVGLIFISEYSLQEEQASNKTEEASKEKTEEKKPSKPVTVREPLEMALQWLDIADTTEDAMSASVKKYD